jgi:hypothetical protein
MTWSGSTGNSAARPHGELDWRPLGEMFVAGGLITEDELESALSQQSETAERLGKILVSNGLVTESDLRGALVDQLGRELEKEGAKPRPLPPPEPRPQAIEGVEAPLTEPPTHPLEPPTAPAPEPRPEPDQTALSELHRHIQELRSALAARTATREAAEQSERRSLATQLADLESTLAAEHAAHAKTKDEFQRARESARAQAAELRAALVRLRQALTDVDSATAWFEYWSGEIGPGARRDENAPPPDD